MSVPRSTFFRYARSTGVFNSSCPVAGELTCFSLHDLLFLTRGVCLCVCVTKVIHTFEHKRFAVFVVFNALASEAGLPGFDSVPREDYFYDIPPKSEFTKPKSETGLIDRKSVDNHVTIFARLKLYSVTYVGD